MKKNLLVSLVLLLTSISTFAVKNAQTNLDEAIQLAQKQKKHVFVLFTGSDWCPPCMKLEAKVISSEAFQKYAEKELIFVFLDYPKSKEISENQKKLNAEYAKRYELKGYPTYMIMDPKKPLEPLFRKSGYDETVTPDEFISMVKESYAKKK